MTQSMPLMRLLVVVGTDHHRFDRVVEWVDAWLRRQHDVQWAVVQHGSAAEPAVAEGHRLIPHAQLQELMGTATAVVTHGGPATIVEVRRMGHLPIVVPRDPDRGEHVDGHQQRFARRMGRDGLVLLCERQEDLDAALDRALHRPESMQLPRPEADQDPTDPAVAAAVARVGGIVDALVAARRSVRPQRRTAAASARRRGRLRRAA